MYKSSRILEQQSTREHGHIKSQTKCELPQAPKVYYFYFSVHPRYPVTHQVPRSTLWNLIGVRNGRRWNQDWYANDVHNVSILCGKKEVTFACKIYSAVEGAPLSTIEAITEATKNDRI